MIFKNVEKKIVELWFFLTLKMKIQNNDYVWHRVKLKNLFYFIFDFIHVSRHNAYCYANIENDLQYTQ